jgi:S1-C subfamily serine protease
MRRTSFQVTVVLAACGLVHAQDAVRDAETQRIAVIAKIRPAVVAVFANGGQGGGSGVIIDADGFALTNFHVVQGVGPTMKCGLSDGVLYDAVLVGLDRVGDVALIKLLSKEKDKPFPCVTLGDSDEVKAGDWSIAMGNPFLLATDFTPTVTFGMVSGVHRYQYPSGTLLEYTDCIQVDTSINPGNSGGPLFNLAGKLIGINGRGSFEKRGRVNSGVGYAISINQIKNFLGHLRAGIDTDHATLGATVKTIEGDDDPTPRVLVQAMLDDCDAFRRGLQPDDELVEFAGRPVSSVNQYKNVLGIYPKGWRLPLIYRRNNSKTEILVRLQALMRGDERELVERPRPGRPQPRPPEPSQPRNIEAMKLYKAKNGYANYYFNEMAQKSLMNRFKEHGDFASMDGSWLIEGELERKGVRSPFKLTIAEHADAGGMGAKTLVTADVSGVLFSLEPLKENPDPRELHDPPGSGGLLMAMYHYHRLLTLGVKGFEGEFAHGGHEPYYLSSVKSKSSRWADRRVDAETIVTEHAAVHGKWFFAHDEARLLGGEISLNKNEDPCELTFDDYQRIGDRDFPHRIEIRSGDEQFGVIHVKTIQAAKNQP